VIAIDTNILIYAHRTDSPFHEAAARRLTELAEGSAAWAIPWPCLHEFLAIVTHHRIYSPPTSVEVALDYIGALLESPSVVLLAETDAHWQLLRSLVMASQTKGGRVHDARIAALCTQHGVRELWSADRDFRRFPALAVVNPLLS
jgi:toxin-antitoxin system PIN domain toxin